jgi:hypothetical protein
MKSRRTRCRILHKHAKDQFSRFPADTFFVYMFPMPQEPRPVELESCSMPANNSFWLDEDKRSPLPVPESAPLHPEQSVGSGKSRLKILPFQNVE